MQTEESQLFLIAKIVYKNKTCWYKINNDKVVDKILKFLNSNRDSPGEVFETKKSKCIELNELGLVFDSNFDEKELNKKSSITAKEAYILHEEQKYFINPKVVELFGFLHREEVEELFFSKNDLLSNFKKYGIGTQIASSGVYGAPEDAQLNFKTTKILISKDSRDGSHPNQSHPEAANPFAIQSGSVNSNFGEDGRELKSTQELDTIVIKRTLAAVEYNDGSKEWWKNGALHRDDKDLFGYLLPAVMHTFNTYNATYSMLKHLTGDGYVNKKAPSGWTNLWYKNGQIHRDEKVETVTVALARMLNQSSNAVELLVSSCLNDNENSTRAGVEDNENSTEQSHQFGSIGGAFRVEDMLALSLTAQFPEALEAIKAAINKGIIDIGLTLPAVVSSNESMQWYKNGALHRDDEVEVHWIDEATLFSYLDISFKKDDVGLCGYENKHQREVGKTKLVLPAVINCEDVKNEESMEWWSMDRRHRANGLPAVEIYSGDKKTRKINKSKECNSFLCYENGLLHRDKLDKDGISMPAILSNKGKMSWYKDGVLHRIDGPAIIEKNKKVEILGTLKDKLVDWDCTLSSANTNNEGNCEKAALSSERLLGNHKRLVLLKGLLKITIKALNALGVNGQKEKQEQWYLNAKKIDKQEHPWWLAKHEKKCIEASLKLNSNVEKNDLDNSNTIEPSIIKNPKRL